MAGHVFAKIVDPDKIEIDMTLRFSLSDWIKLSEQFNAMERCSWPANELRMAVIRMTGQLRKQFEDAHSD